MCKTEELPKDLDPAPPAMRADSTLSNNYDGSDSDDSNGRITPTGAIPETATTMAAIARRRRQIPVSGLLQFIKLDSLPVDYSDRYEVPFKFQSQVQEGIDSKECVNVAISVGSGILNATFWVVFSLYFPFFLAPYAATQTYHTAYYQYYPEKSYFDNSIWTYGTDYLLAIIMTIIVIGIMKYSYKGISDRLCRRISSLLALYGVSVIAGGCAHQFFTTLESRNTIAFRFLWTVCVGTVCSASCAMGMAGTEAFRKYQVYEQEQRKLKPTNGADSSSQYCSLLRQVPLVSEAFWMAFGITVTAVCAVGGMSFQRPACDIFIAGITQSPSTFYCMIFFFLVQHPKIEMWAKIMGLVGFILNAPLLPMYPLLVQYTDWSLASVNTLLHCWLCVAWSMQGMSMRHVIQALVSDADVDSTNQKNKRC